MKDILLFDRVKELTHITGTSDILLEGAADGFSAFADYYSVNDAVFYAITDELSGFSIASASNDTNDSDGNPLFIKTTWTTTGETSGDVVGYLIHEPTSKTGSTRNDFGGATDFEIEFEVHVEE